MARLKKGDRVAVLSGRDRGKRGKVLKVFPNRQAALVERINLVKHFERRTQANQPGGIVEKEALIALDKLVLVCPQCNRPTRVGSHVADGAKHRICKQCREVIA